MNKTTDWTKYYQSPYKTASLTRRITGRILIQTLKQYFPGQTGIDIIEIGGANSAFLELFLDAFSPSRYVIIDNNATGLEKTKERIKSSDNVALLNADILKWENQIPKSDLVISIGLIEHFDARATRKVIQVHFEMLKPGGIVLMTFPTPTFLYRAARYVSEKLGLWIFHDERPLPVSEVLETAKEYGRQMECRIIWPIVLTQGLVVFRKPGGPA